VQGKELLDKGAAMILVTGAAGNNGQAAVRELSGQSVKVRALVRDASKATAISDLANVEVVQGDNRARHIKSTCSITAAVMAAGSRSAPGVSASCGCWPFRCFWLRWGGSWAACESARRAAGPTAGLDIALNACVAGHQTHSV
jgi:NAD(P)-dependent dehydrogenase (short-subunit alcohol dehydrogenase family)